MTPQNLNLKELAAESRNDQGVPQERVLGLVFFLLYIVNILRMLKDIQLNSVTDQVNNEAVKSMCRCFYLNALKSSKKKKVVMLTAKDG